MYPLGYLIFNYLNSIENQDYNAIRRVPSLQISKTFRLFWQLMNPDSAEKIKFFNNIISNFGS